MNISNLNCSSGQRVAIIGGGISGLFTGYFMSKKGYNVTVFEKDSSLGGLAGILKLKDNIFIEKLYHHIFPQDKELISFIKKSRLKNNLIWHKNSVGIVIDNYCYPIDSLSNILKLKKLKFIDKYKTFFFILKMANSNNWKKWDRINAYQMINRYCGTRAWQNIFLPLLRLKFGDCCSDISGAWIWDKIKQKIGCRTMQRGERLGTLKGSLHNLLDFLSKEILKNGSEIFTNSNIEKVLIKNDKLEGIVVGNKIHHFNQLIATIPIPEFLKIIPSTLIDEHEKIQRLKKIEYVHSLCMILRLKKPLNKQYWISICAANNPFSVIISHTNFVTPDSYGGEHIVYLAKYVSSPQELFNETDQKLFYSYFSYLKKLFPDIDENWVIDYHVTRSLYSQPFFKANFTRIKPDFLFPIKGIYLMNTSQLFPRSRTLNNSLILAKQFVNKYF